MENQDKITDKSYKNKISNNKQRPRTYNRKEKVNNLPLLHILLLFASRFHTTEIAEEASPRL